MIRRIIKYGAASVLLALSLAVAYRVGVYAQDGFNKGYSQGRQDAMPEFIKRKPDINKLFLQG